MNDYEYDKLMSSPYPIQEYEKQHQYEIPPSLNFLAEQYPFVTWKEAQHLYSIAIEETLMKYHVSRISEGELGFGRGRNIAKYIFMDKLKQLTEEKKKQ